MKKNRIIEDIKISLKDMHPYIEVHLYGSEARGDAKEGSDIDLLILVLKDNVTLQDELKITAPLYDIELQTGVLINTLILPKKEWGKVVTPFYENVMQDAIAL